MDIGKNQPFIVSIFFMALFGAYLLITLFMGKIDQQVLSILANIVMVIVGYYFGSSKSSGAKDATIAAMVNNDPSKENT